ncbi:hypothetical protein [Thiomonas sp. X19]|uniref:hypothetical protein n=1 Tax=Thiomonas sp. X19 TaxID=1050370 RepID=UPI001E49FDC5|nr:hypothetical protein [Thiomonas sp. X19]
MVAHVEGGEFPWAAGPGKGEQPIQSVRSADDVPGLALRILNPILHGQDVHARRANGLACPKQEIGIGCQRCQRLCGDGRRLATDFGRPQDGAVWRLEIDGVKTGMPRHEAAQGLHRLGVRGRRVGVGSVKGHGGKLQLGESRLKATGDGVRIGGCFAQGFLDDTVLDLVVLIALGPQSPHRHQQDGQDEDQTLREQPKAQAHGQVCRALALVNTRSCSSRDAGECARLVSAMPCSPRL